MIDIESTVFDYVATALREEYKGISVASTSSDTPAKFPAVCLWEQREIAAFVDRKMQELGFIRTFGQPVPNVADMTIYRYTMRFSGIIGRDNIVYTS